MSVPPTPSLRLDGLDLARFVALVGMVIVNFAIVMGADGDTGVAHAVSQALSGRAAATFVVLAGIGLGLARKRDGAQALTVRRAAFLAVIGCLNTLLFPADILHYYAVYFALGALLLAWSARALLIAAVAANGVFVVLLLTLDYDTGWDWSTLDYADLWTPAGFVRNLLFNGWHPVFPWVGFLFVGMALSRLDLGAVAVQGRLAAAGLAGLLAVEALSHGLIGAVAAGDPERVALFATDPIPPTPLYSIAGLSAASLIIGTCLLCAESARRVGLMPLLAPAGRQTLTLYVAHIVIGMGTLEALGLLGDQSAAAALSAAVVFCVVAAVYARLWSRRWRRGPLEALMRRVTG